jgi:uncharacterized protein YceK
MYVHWLLSPVIRINDMGNAHLNFDLAVTKAKSNDPLNSVERGDQSAMFMVAVSDDGGNTWKRANATIWDNAGGDYVFDEIKNGENIRIDLSEFTNKNIQVAFFCRFDRPTPDSYAAVDFHIDNFRINNYYEEVVQKEICQTQDYFDDNFSILNKDIQVGFNEYNRIIYVPENKPDTVYTLELTATPMVEYHFSRTICKGDTYTEGGFNASTAGMHERKLVASNGCDSVAYLNLTVIEIPETVLFDTICLGGSIVWNGMTLTEAGESQVTLTSSTGCDSTVTLKLTVEYEKEYYEREICYGESIEIGDLGFISQSGHYVDTVTSASGCATIITVDLTILPDYTSVVDTAICPGERYVGNGFTGGLDKTGSYSASYMENGCDASITLNLVVLDPNRPVRFEHYITREQLPFEFFGKVFGTNTANGTYNELMTVNAENCSGEVELILNVGVGLDNISKADRLMITPNPVNAGEDVFVHLELTPAQRNGLTVQVYTSAGTLVKSFMPEAEEIVIRDLYTSGVYMIRIVDGTGKAYQGKVIVR